MKTALMQFTGYNLSQQMRISVICLMATWSKCIPDLIRFHFEFWGKTFTLESTSGKQLFAVVCSTDSGKPGRDMSGPCASSPEAWRRSWWRGWWRWRPGWRRPLGASPRTSRASGPGEPSPSCRAAPRC